MKIRWRTFSFLVCGGLLLIGIWLIWQLPEQGFFRLDLKSIDLPGDGMVLVQFKEGKLANSYPLASAGIGWAVFRELWPLVLLSMLLGYPLGVWIHWFCQFVVVAEKGPKKEISSQEMELRELAANLSAEVWAKTLKLQDMHREARQAKGEIFLMKVATGDQKKNHAALEQKTESLERELFKARAKIRRLESKRPGKPVDDDQWPE